MKAPSLLITALLLSAPLRAQPTASPLPEAYSGHAVVASGGFLYSLGGLGGVGGGASAPRVFYAPLSADGSAGAWAAGPDLPTGIFFHAAVAAGGSIYVLGGYHISDSMEVSAAVYHSRLGPDGRPGAWQTDAPLPETVFFPSAAYWNGRIYVTGGWTGSQLTAGVYSAEVKSDGSLGAWVTQRALPEGVYTHAAVSAGTLYVLGGGGSNGGGVVQNTVYAARILPDGSLEPWRLDSPLPEPVSNHSAAIAGGRVIVSGGWTGAAPTNAVVLAPIGGDGSLGTWSELARLPKLLYLHSAAAWDRWLYVVGGSDGQYTQDAVYVLELPAPLPPPQPDDTLPPRTALAIEGARYGAAPVFTTPAGLLRLSAADDRSVVGDGAGAGVRETLAGLDGAPLAPYLSALAAGAEGPHRVAFASVDLAGNREAERSEAYAVDGTAPAVSIEAGQPRVASASGADIIGPAARVAVSAQDPAAGGVASGLALVTASVDGAAVDPESSFALPAQDGAHRVAASAVDNLGHAASASRDFLVDATAPAVSWSASPAAVPAADGGAPWLRGGAAVSLSGSDPVVNGVSAGFHHAEFAVDGGTWTAAASFGLDEGPRLVALRGFDAVGNQSAPVTFAVRVDASAPRTALVLGAAAPTPETELSLQSEDAGSGVAAVFLGVDGGSPAPYAGVFRLAEGEHLLQYYAVDRAGNIEPRRSAAVTVKAADAQPPVTELVAGAPSWGAAPVFVSPLTPLELRASDAGGVDSSSWALDEAAFSAYRGTFSLSAEGAHWLRFFSVDLAGNQEAARGAAVAVDATAPAVAVSIGAPRAVLAGGETVVSPATPLSVSAEDPVSGGVASGLASVTAAEGGRALDPDAPFTLAAEGAHEVVVSASDRVGHGAQARVPVLVDATGPAVSWSAEPAASAGWLRGGSRVLLSAVDPVSAGVAAGVHHAEYSIDGGAWTSAASFGVEEGERSVRVRAFDNVGNAGPETSFSLRVDATAPVSTFKVGAPVTTLFGREVVTPATSLELSAEDPASGGVASGVARLTYSVDGGAEAEYAGPFRLGPGEHTVSYGAVDAAGNAEPRRSASVAVSAFLSDAVQALDSVTLSGGARVSGSVRAGGEFKASGGSVVTGDVTAASVKVDNKSAVEGAVSETGGAASEALSLPEARAEAERESLELRSGGSLDLAAGSYRIGSLKLTSGSRLTVSGRVTLFVSGDIEVTGGASVNESGAAEDLWVVSEGGRVSVNGKSRAAWHLYAPRAEVSFGGGGQFVGRVLGRVVSLSGHAALPPGGALPPLARRGAAVKADRAQDEPARGGKARGGRGEAEVLEARLEKAAAEGAARREGRSGAPARSLESLPAAPKLAAARRVEAPASVADRAPLAAPAKAALERREPAARISRAAVAAAAPAHGSSGRAGASIVRRASSLPALPLSARAAFSVVDGAGRAVRSKAGAGVVVPAGAAGGALALTVSPAADSDAAKRRREEARERRGLASAGAAVEYGPHGTRFDKPVTLELPFDPALEGAALAVHYWNPSTEEWEALPSSVDRQAGLVRAQTTHFSLYQVLAGGTPPAAASGELAFGEVYAFPNPARPGQTPTIHVDAGAAETVEVRVYDVSGRLVATLSRAGSGDLAWDAAGAGTGVYLFVATAKRGGASIATKGRLAVIR